MAAANGLISPMPRGPSWQGSLLVITHCCARWGFTLGVAGLGLRVQPVVAETFVSQRA